MKVSIVGNGNVAQNLAFSFVKKGHCLLDMFAPNYSKLETFCAKVKCRALKNVSELNPENDIVIIAIDDEALPLLIESLPSHTCVYAHCSGSQPIDIFKQNKELQHYGVFYPLYSFVKERQEDFSNIPIFTESSETNSHKIITQLAQSISSQVAELNSEERPYYHLSGVLVNNFANHIWALTQELLENKNLDFNKLRPILLQTGQNAFKTKQIKNIQTGPAKRNNTKIIKKHLSLLNENEALKELYKLLSLSIQNNL